MIKRLLQAPLRGLAWIVVMPLLGFWALGVAIVELTKRALELGYEKA